MIGRAVTADRLAEHRRYDSDEFDYAGCVVCDTSGDTLGWPCPTVRAAGWPVFYDPTTSSVEG